jgi:hypothetical protein
MLTPTARRRLATGAHSPQKRRGEGPSLGFFGGVWAWLAGLSSPAKALAALAAALALFQYRKWKASQAQKAIDALYYAGLSSKNILR